MRRFSPAGTTPLAALVLVLGVAPRAVAAEPWEVKPTAEQAAELRKQVAALGGRSWENHRGVETVALPAADLAKLAAMQFRVGVALTHEPADADLKTLARHPGIVAVFVASSKVTDAGLKELAAMKGLAELDVSHTAITDRGLADLAALPALRDLNLVGTKVTAEGVRHLGGRKLRALELPEAARTDLGLKNYLAAVEKLESFDNHYGWPGVTDDGLAVLSGNRSLHTMSWWPDAKVGPTFRKVLPTLTSLDHLSLEGSAIEDEDLKILAALPKLAAVNIAGTRVTDAGLKHLAGSRTLRSLALGRTKITDAGLQDLAGLPALRELYLMNTPVTDAGMRHLAAAPELRTLHLEKTGVTSTGLKVFAGRKLEMVWGDDSLRTEEVLLVLLPNMPEGDDLELSGWRLTDAGLEQVVKRRGVKRLALRGTFTEKGLAKLATLAELRSLFVDTEKFTTAGVRPWRELASLESLSLVGTVSEAVLLELQGFESLTSLQVGGVLTAGEMRALAGIEQLKRLTLDDAGFTDAGVEALARSQSLTNLSARQSGLTDKGLLALAGVKTLEYVDVSYSGVTPQGKAAFARLRPDCEVYEGE